MLQDGGSSKGTIRFKEELAHGANAGLDTAIMWLEPVYKKVKTATLAFKCLKTAHTIIHLPPNCSINRHAPILTLLNLS